MWGDVRSPRVVKGVASAMRSNGRTLIAARAIRGNSPPEEGGATLATAEGPTSYRLVGVAPADGRRFKSCTAHQRWSRGAVQAPQSFLPSPPGRGGRVRGLGGLGEVTLTSYFFFRWTGNGRSGGPS